VQASSIEQVFRSGGVIVAKLRSGAHLLLGIVLLVLVGSPFAKRLADLGQDIIDVTPST